MKIVLTHNGAEDFGIQVAEDGKIVAGAGLLVRAGEPHPEQVIGFVNGPAVGGPVYIPWTAFMGGQPVGSTRLVVLTGRDALTLSALVVDVDGTTPGVLSSRLFARWRQTGERGLSADAIARRLTGMEMNTRDDRSHPYDCGDFRRCELLLRQVPEARQRLRLMADVSEEWARLVDAWDEIVATYEREAPGVFDRHSYVRRLGPAPQTHRLIQVALGR